MKRKKQFAEFSSWAVRLSGPYYKIQTNDNSPISDVISDIFHD